MSFLFCSSCQKEYGDNDDSENAPKVLSCGHTFCSKCIKEKMIKDNEIICSIDGTKDERTFEKIPFNRIIYDMILKEREQNNIMYDTPKENCDLTLNIGLIGNWYAGKTSLTRCYQNNKPFEKENKYLPTFPLNCINKKINKYGKYINVQVWDTAGQEKYNSLTSGYLGGLHGCFIVFDVTDRYSFQNLNTWIQFYCNFNRSHEKILIILGNKIDKENRMVSFEEGNNFAKSKEMSYFETSAITMKNINEAFDKMINYILESLNDDITSITSRKSSKVNMSKILSKKKHKKIQSKKDRCC